MKFNWWKFAKFGIIPSAVTAIAIGLIFPADIANTISFFTGACWGIVGVAAALDYDEV